jgi:hypothetical protein
MSEHTSRSTKEHRFTDADGANWLVRPHDGPLGLEILRLAAREKALIKCLDDLCEAVSRGRIAVTPALEKAHIELAQGPER